MDQFLAEIRIFAGNFPPTGWALCDGQLLSISQNTALFSLLGTTYGGDGKTTFALPDLRGSAPLQAGQGPGLTLRDLGETGGSTSVTLLLTEMPSHKHVMQCDASGGTGNMSPGPAQTWGGGGRGAPPLYTPSVPGKNVQMNPLGTSFSGGGMPHNNMPPYLGLTFVIVLQGIFPARS